MDNIKDLENLALKNKKANESIKSVKDGSMITIPNGCPLCGGLTTEDLTGYHVVKCVNDDCKYYECDIWSYKEDKEII